MTIHNSSKTYQTIFKVFLFKKLKFIFFILHILISTKKKFKDRNKTLSLIDQLDQLILE